MSSRDNPSNPRVGVVTSSKFPPSSLVQKNATFDGYICTFAAAGEAIPFGSVLRPSTAADRQVVQTTALNDLKVVGVAVNAASSGERVCMATGGEFQLLVTGAVTRGDLIAASNTTGVAVVTPDDDAPGQFAVAMNSDANTGTKLVWVRFIKAEVY